MTITLITGANKGLGRETARRLVELGHTVLVGARGPGRGAEAAAASVREGTDAIVALATEVPGAGSGRFVARTGEITWS